MFTNIGRKIKILARVICGLGIIVSVISAVTVWVTAAQTNTVQTSYGVIYTRPSGVTSSIVLSGFTTLIAGCLASWVGSLCLYGFGELIDRAKSIDETLKANGLRTEEDKEEAGKETEKETAPEEEISPEKETVPETYAPDPEKQKMLEELKRRLAAGEDCKDPYGWLISSENMKYVHCPQCGKKYSNVYMKGQPACPECGYPHVKQEKKEEQDPGTANE